MLNSFEVVIPKLVLIEPSDEQQSTKNGHCEDVSYTVAASISCLFDKRKAAEEEFQQATRRKKIKTLRPM